MIGCDECNDWFHASCVGLSVSEAEKLEKFLCPSCANERYQQQKALKNKKNRKNKKRYIKSYVSNTKKNRKLVNIHLSNNPYKIHYSEDK